MRWPRYRHLVAVTPSPPSPRQRLPRGRSALSPDEVRRIHRQRLCSALAEEMAENGYVRTSVQDVLKRAGVSRRAFYELFSSKLDCFLTAFDYAGERLMNSIFEAGGMEPGGELGRVEDPMGLFGIAISAYLNALADELPYARLFLIESYAAGPEAIERRARTQEAMVGLVAELTGAAGPSGRYTCTMFVAAVASMVTLPIAAGDRDAVRALGPQLTEHVRRLWNAGAFTEPVADPCRPGSP